MVSGQNQEFAILQAGRDDVNSTAPQRLPDRTRCSPSFTRVKTRSPFCRRLPELELMRSLWRSLSRNGTAFDSSKNLHHSRPTNSRSPVRQRIWALGKTRSKRSSNSIRSSLLLLPRLSSIVDITGKATPS